ncbi:hypothetical protein BDW02DRAFT_611410 [Decorospora gaudefroyi]|uniref:F-box domain-containing protein n=1 Tax=Decorospora gaudefroyi TaxID=184978 RepID=A0A6A5KT16_9PLEO|nr:hypothetical protein BDW02DRAFT_611410 [Decorospora gaudefroyi]
MSRVCIEDTADRLAHNTPVEGLPTEMIEEITAHLDDPTLIGFTIASPVLRSKAYYKYGQRFFTHIPIGMNPIGLQALKDISSRSELAKHVRSLNFGTSMSMTDPSHDLEVIKRKFVHSPRFDTRKKDDDELRASRIRCNGLYISQALPKFPKLESITYGNRSPGSELVSRCIGAAGFCFFTCPSGHCDGRMRAGDEGILESIALALNSTQLPSVRLGFDWCYCFRPFLPTAVTTNPSAATTIPNEITTLETVRKAFGARTWHLRLRFRMENNMRAFDTPWAEWQSSNIDALDVRYPVPMALPATPPLFGQELGIRSLPLKNLRQLTLEHLWTVNTTLYQFLQSSLALDRITQISLVQCSVRALTVINDWDDTPITGHWRRIIETLQRMPNLSKLHLDRLECSDCATVPQSCNRDHCLDIELALAAKWTSREQVYRGLRHIRTSYQILQVNMRALSEEASLFLHHGGLDKYPYQRYYVNLRWANLKAEPHVYAFSKKEMDGLRRLRFDGLMDGEVSVRDVETYDKIRRMSRLSQVV